MRYRVGFDRELKLEWLDEIVEQINKIQEGKMVKSQMMKYLSAFDLSDNAILKRIQILRKIWLNVPVEHTQIRDEAIKFFYSVDKDEKIWLHWGMCLLAYPFFRDVAEIIGILYTIQNKISMRQIKRRFNERYGNRATTDRAIGRIVRSLVLWGILKKSEKNGVYEFSENYSTDKIELQKWFVHVLILANHSEVTPLDQIPYLNFIFPFKITINSYELKKSNKLRFYREGSGLEMVSYLSPKNKK